MNGSPSWLNTNGCDPFMKLVFFGSSDFSLPPLEACLASGMETALVVTTPDQKKGRGLEQLPNVVRRFCLERRLACEAFESLKDPQALERVKSLKPDVFVVASYGKIIPAAWLQVPAHRLNVHPSLLPKYRGAAPLNWPILDGEKETGLSIAEITSKLDSGDLFFQEKITLDARMDAECLSTELSRHAAKALGQLLTALRQGKTLARTPQDEGRASYARKLTKEDGRLDWQEDAVAWDRKIRGLKPWPGAFVFFGKESLAVLAAEPLEKRDTAKPGTLLAIGKDGSVQVQTGNGILRWLEVKPAGRKAMSAADFARGRRLEPGFDFSAAGEV